MPTSGKNLRARLRRLLNRAEPDVIAAVMGVTRGTVLRWKRTGIPTARVNQLEVIYQADKAAKRSKPIAGKARYERRNHDRSTVWDASTSAHVTTPDQALAVASLLLSRLKKQRFPSDSTYQWVIRGKSIHKRDEVVKGAYTPRDLKGKMKEQKTRDGRWKTPLTLVPEHAFGRLDVCARDLARRLTSLEPFFRSETISIVVRKAKKL